MICAGVDIGSVATKAVLLEAGRVLASALVPSGARPRVAAEQALAGALERAGLARERVARLTATGYGRRVADFGGGTVTEITACARGGRFLGAPGGQARTLIDLGGQDLKVIALDAEGGIRDFLMNDKCAAGTGRFLEVMAQALEVSLDDLGRLALEAERAEPITATCTVFAESEVISLLARNVPKEAIIAGIHNAVAERILTMVRRLGPQPALVFVGGGARNPGLVAALGRGLAADVHVPDQPHFVNALGAALIAAEA